MDDQYDPKAFLFSVVNKPGLEPVKLPQTGENSGKQQFLVKAFCDIRNNRGLGKFPPSARLITLTSTLIFPPNMTKTSSN